MTTRANTLHPKPDYTLHRSVSGSPVAADTADLDALFQLPGNDRAAIDCKGWKTVQVLAVLGGGTSPTVDIQPLEYVKGDDILPGYTDEGEGFIVLASTIAGVSDGDLNEVTVHQGRLYLRIHAVGGVASPTSVKFFIAGKERAVSITGQS